MRQRLPYCPGYTGDHVTAPIFYGFSIPRSMIVYGQYLDMIPGTIVEGVEMPELSRFILILDGSYPVYTTISTFNAIYNWGEGGGYRTLNRELHGRGGDSLNFLMADGSAKTLKAPLPDARNGGIPNLLASVPGHFIGRPDAYAFPVNTRYSELHPAERIDD